MIMVEITTVLLIATKVITLTMILTATKCKITIRIVPFFSSLKHYKTVKQLMVLRKREGNQLPTKP